MMSKRSAYIAITVLAAISVEIGCNDGSHKVTQRKAIPAASGKMVTQQKIDPATGQPMMKNGQPVMETVPEAQSRDFKAKNGQGNGSVTTSTNAPPPPVDAQGKPIIKDLPTQKDDSNVKYVADAEAAQAKGDAVTRDELKAGTYKLKNIVTSVRVDVGGVNGVARAIQGNNVVAGEGGRGVRLESANNTAQGGMVANFVDKLSDGRKVNIPVSFKVDLSSGKWTPDRNQASSISFVDSVSTDSSGKLVLKDRPDVADTTNPVSILDMLNTGTLQTDNSYRLELPNNVVAYLRLLQKSDTQLVAYMIFEEQRSERDKLDMDRSMFFSFDLSPDTTKAAAAPAGSTNTGDDTFKINSTTTSESL